MGDSPVTLGRRWATYLWPGLPQICGTASWSGLAVAVGFGLLVNLGLAASLLWSELLTDAVRTLVWGVVAIVWVGSALISLRLDRLQAAERQEDGAGLFAEAIAEYLKGNWFETERRLRHLLKRNPRDVDARLLLATLLRHTGRLEEAACQLDALQRWDDAVKWDLEIHRERQLLQAAQAELRVSSGGEEAEPHEAVPPDPEAGPVRVAA